MRAVILERQGEPVEATTLPDPEPSPGQLRLTIRACAVCRTDLHLRDHEIEATKLPVVLGHQIVGTTDDGRRVGVPWLGWTDGTCRYCTSDRENLCVNGRFTGRDIDGGFAEMTVADERYCLELPRRALRRAGGAAAVRRIDRLPRPQIHRRRHQARAVWLRLGRAPDLPGRGAPGPRGLRVHARRRRADPELRDEPGRGLGRRQRRAATRATRRRDHLRPGRPPRPAGAPRARARRHGRLRRHPHDRHPEFPYEILWGERSIRSVANLTRRDGEEFLALAPKVPVRTTVTTYPLGQVEEALSDLRAGRFEGTAVILP